MPRFNDALSYYLHSAHMCICMYACMSMVTFHLSGVMILYECSCWLHYAIGTS
ncbi:hypothetical protein BDV24DRAFT_130767 [Aspergillus arachidicola]|uniref:Uncharacterized protein n=1 Tax=Aspergillus arachidicola TaxID=656916 RepID=A0A5N6YA51_9EURO|nr:hypothetical protein BDV24DRAFT_130767 [Aspergillus arachidicola]